MQIDYSPRSIGPSFIRSFMLGLVASSAGALVALPGLAMPEPNKEVVIEAVETTDEGTEATRDTAVESDIELVDATDLPTPTAEETLPSPEEALEAEAADEEMTDDATVVEEEIDEAIDTEAADASEEINTEDFTIAELTDNSDSFTILAAALAAADLTEVLSDTPYLPLPMKPLKRFPKAQ